MPHVHAMVVIETTWPFINLRELRADTRTVNISSGLRASSGDWSGLSSVGVHPILRLHPHFHSLGMDRELQALVIVCSRPRGPTWAAAAPRSF